MQKHRCYTRRPRLIYPKRRSLQHRSPFRSGRQRPPPPRRLLDPPVCTSVPWCTPCHQPDPSHLAACYCSPPPDPVRLHFFPLIFVGRCRSDSLRFTVPWTRSTPLLLLFSFTQRSSFAFLVYAYYPIYIRLFMVYVSLRPH